MKKFYVYILSRPDGNPFYVGMGSGNRMHKHESLAKNEKSYKASIIRSIQTKGQSVGKAVVARFDSDIEAKELERQLIASIGRKDLGRGPLANRTDGGDGVTGWTEEMREAHSKRMSSVMARPEIVSSCRAHMQRLHSLAGWSDARAAEIRAFWDDPVNRLNQAKKVAERFKDSAVRSAHGDVIRRDLASPEAKEKMRAAKLGKKQPAWLIEKRAAALRKPRSPGSGERISAGKRAAAARRAASATESRSKNAAT